MRGPWSLLLLGFLPSILGASPSGPAIRPAEFRDWFRDAVNNDLQIPEDIEQAATRLRYVFVAGFRNEKMGGYFVPNVRELRALGVPRESISVIEPSSNETISGNADEVQARFREIASRGPESIVVIGHSRGACDALAFALRNPRFVRDHIRAMFLIQGPFGGTGVADFVTGDGPPLDRKLPLRLRAMANLAGGIERRQVERGKLAGLPDLTREASEKFWDETLRDHADAIPIVGPKTYYVTTEVPSYRLKRVRRVTAQYLAEHFGANDGIVALDDQSLPELGVVLAVLDASHFDLTSRFPATGWGSHSLRKALIQSIVMAVGQPDRRAARPRDRGAEFGGRGREGDALDGRPTPLRERRAAGRLRARMRDKG